MSDLSSNPYAAPLSPAAPPPLAPSNILRDGKFLIIRDGAILPDVCPVTGDAIESAPGGYRKPKKIVWTPPIAYIGLLFGLLIGLLLMIVTQKRGQLSYGLSAAAKNRIQKKRLIGTLLLLSGIGCIAGAIFVQQYVATFAIAAAVLVIASLVFFAIADPIRAAGYRKEAWFKVTGCSTTFLNTLPEVSFKSLS